MSETRTRKFGRTWVSEAIDNAVNSLTAGFSWNDTPEGHDYWQAVCDRLEEMIPVARAKEDAERRRKKPATRRIKELKGE